MKKTKTQKGITLIALIITIVVLLILAVVAINSITDTGIIAHTENSTGIYNNSVKNEANVLGNYLAFLEEATRCEHDWNASTGKCSKCSIVCTHDVWSEWEVKTEATNCQTPGLQERTCTQCGNTQEESIAGSHTYGEYLTITEGSCVTQTDGVQERTCTLCNAKETQPIPWEHTYEQAPNYCVVCYYCAHSGETYHYTWDYKDVCFTRVTCTACNEETVSEPSEHWWFGDNICDICGTTCEHDWSNIFDGKNGKCTICELEHTHEWTDTEDNKSKCTVCQLEHTHNWSNKDGKCANCGTVCPVALAFRTDESHYNFGSSSCDTCGWECPGGYEINQVGDCTHCYGAEH